LATYGSDNGFGWQLNQIVSAQIISVPSQEIFANAQRTWTLIMGLCLKWCSTILDNTDANS
jgi:hypothetical protein